VACVQSAFVRRLDDFAVNGNLPQAAERAFLDCQIEENALYTTAVASGPGHAQAIALIRAAVEQLKAKPEGRNACTATGDAPKKKHQTFANLSAPSPRRARFSVRPVHTRVARHHEWQRGITVYGAPSARRPTSASRRGCTQDFASTRNCPLTRAPEIPDPCPAQANLLIDC
jgi:hypothetical protein